MPLVDEQDIINTYSEEEQLSCKKYAEYKELIRENIPPAKQIRGNKQHKGQSRLRQAERKRFKKRRDSPSDSTAILQHSSPTFPPTTRHNKRPDKNKLGRSMKTQ